MDHTLCFGKLTPREFFSAFIAIPNGGTTFVPMNKEVLIKGSHAVISFW